MAEVAERYVEQIQTTVETMRRRVLAYYDGVFFIGNKLITAAERARDVAEPIAYEVKDYIATATSQSEPVSQVDKDTKNNIVEMYLGISVLMLGISSGELAGAFVFPPVLEYIFDLYVEVIVLFLIPTYVYLNIRKNAAMDDTERRTCLFGFCLASGILLGHLIGGTLTSIVPSVFFIPPLLLALLMDNELLRTPLAAMERNAFFTVGGFASSILCTILAIVATGKISFAVFLISLVHVAFLTLHFQVVTQSVKEKIMLVGESQFSYIVGILIIQILMTAMFGSNPNAHMTTKISENHHHQ